MVEKFDFGFYIYAFLVLVAPVILGGWLFWQFKKEGGLSIGYDIQSLFKKLSDQSDK